MHKAEARALLSARVSRTCALSASKIAVSRARPRAGSAIPRQASVGRCRALSILSVYVPVLRLSCPAAPPIEATSGAAGFEPLVDQALASLRRVTRAPPPASRSSPTAEPAPIPASLQSNPVETVVVEVFPIERFSFAGLLLPCGCTI